MKILGEIALYVVIGAGIVSVIVIGIDTINVIRSALGRGDHD